MCPRATGKDIAEYKRLGVRILGVYPPCLQGEVYETHPDWRASPPTPPRFRKSTCRSIPTGGCLPLGPYGDSSSTCSPKS